ncbi:MAG: hypothetical protein LBT86_01660 [Deltaproteobacteria bacterium]|nr:hypothetical protein [Deltaproteobacteria bacterium]
MKKTIKRPSSTTCSSRSPDPFGGLWAYEYVINGRSAIEWILDRYQVKVDKDSGLKNDPNDWAKEQKEPRYILDLLLRVITVSLETNKIVNALPRLKF